MGSPAASKPELVLLRGTRAPVDADAGGEVLTWQAFQERLAERGKRSQLRRYNGVELRVRFLDRMHRPCATALLLRGVARGGCRIVDDDGRAQRVSAGHCLRTLRGAAADRLGAAKLLRETSSRLDALEAQLAERGGVRFDPGRRPICLRTDLTFGLTAGGSVGHVAGVLNALGEWTAAPLWLTTDTLPTVQPGIEHELLLPGSRHWEHVERVALAANTAYTEQTDRAATRINAGMVYQRYSLNNFAGLQLAAQHRLPLVIEFNGSEPWIARQWAGGPLQYESVAQRIETMNLRYADLVVVVSEPMRDTAIELGASPERVLVNPNGVDPDRYHPAIDGAPVRGRLGLAGKTVIGFIGTFDRWHGAPVLVDAVAKLLEERPALRTSLACLMIGDGPEYGEVRRRVAQQGLETVIHLTGRIAQEDGPGHLAACDILASPHVPNADGSAFFGSPTKLFEYLAMGRPVVASRLGQLGEVLEDQRTALLVKPGDAGSLAEALGRLVNDASLRARLGAAGRAQAEREHTWHRHTQRIVDRLATLVNG